MIEVNLIRKRKISKMPVILGIDFAEVKWLPLILAAIIYNLPEYLVFPEWDAEVAKAEEATRVLRTEERTLNSFIKRNSDLDVKLNAYNKQIADLKRRTKQVDKIVSTKISPKKLLERISKNTPKSLWLNSLLINEDRSIKLLGGANNYKSIGEFLHLLNGSKFFESSLQLIDSKTVEESKDGSKRRFEQYEIRGPIKSFDPWR